MAGIVMLTVAAAEPTPTPSSGSSVQATARPAKNKRIRLGAFHDPFGRAAGSEHKATPLLRFRDNVDVHTQSPPDLNVKAAEWWAHWGLKQKPGPPTGVPTHKDMLQKMSGTPAPAFDQLAAIKAAMQQAVKLLKKESMPPADPETIVIDGVEPLKKQ
ncbi:MAG: hypothetical protein MUF51_02270 [Vicinamibacteria bacterium]|jgi:hypothetical protein|nr:hypothetical protein [Vicinamibacteria bacterium]